MPDLRDAIKVIADGGRSLTKIKCRQVVVANTWMICTVILNTSYQNVNAQQPSKMYIVQEDSPLLQVARDNVRVLEQLPVSAVLIADREEAFGNPPRLHIHVQSISPPRTVPGWILKDNILHFESLMERKAKDVPALISAQKAQVQQAWRDVQKAIAENEKLPEKDQVAEPYLARAEIYSLVGCRDEALRDYSKAVMLIMKPGQRPEVYGPYIAKLHAAVQQRDRQPRPAELGAYDSHLSHGLKAYRDAKLELAERHLSNAIQIDPSQHLAWYFRGLTFKRLKQDLRAQHDVLIAVYLERKGGAFGEQDRAFMDVQGPLRSWMEEYRLGDPSQKIILGTKY